jgi:hypothetical protein
MSVTADKAQRFSKENPSVYFITGYMPMAPDGEKESIGKILLNTKAVAIMGETRLGYWYSHWKNQRDGGMHSIIYYFTQAMLDGKSTGEALYHSFAYASEHDYYNAYSYGVLYGDPSLSLEEKKRAETKPPGAPVNLRGSLSGNTVRLTWSPSDKGTYSIDGYTIFRGTDANVLSYVTNVSSSTLQWEDKSVQAGNTYYYYVKAFDIRKNFSAESNKVSVIYKSQPGDTKPPSIVVFEPANNSQTTQSVINVIGQVTDDDSGVSLVTLDQKRISYDQQGNFNEKVSLKEGLNLIEIQAEDRSGNKSELTLRITRINEEKKDTTPPSIRIFYPKNGDTFSSESVEINGRIWDEDSGIDRASMNTKPLVLSKDGTFAASVLLKSGTNSILFEAWDKDGNYASEEFFLIRTDETIIKLTIGNTTAFVNGKAVPLDVPPTIIAGRTMVPIRFISEAFGAEVQWESETRTVRIYFEKTQTRVTLQINNTIARINDKIVTLDAPPQILNGRTMVPIRFISEAFGASVDWDNATRTVTITLSI